MLSLARRFYRRLRESRANGLEATSAPRRIMAELGNHRPRVFWGGEWVPFEDEVTHFCVAGATGSGKTVMLRLLMQSVLPLVRAQPDTRALVYDAKRELHQIIYGILKAHRELPGSGENTRPEDWVRTLDPFDTRCYAWNMGADVTSAPSALEIASILAPVDKNDANPFFLNAGRDILCGVMRSFIRAGQPWTLRDVLLATMNRDDLKAILKRDATTRHLLNERYRNPKLLSDVIATLGSKLMYFEPIAAAWHRAAQANRTLSLKDWTKEGYILLLGNDEENRSALDAMNRLLFKRISELLLARPPDDRRRTWIILDEFPKAGRLDGIDDLLTKGRAYGTCVVLGFQDIEALRDRDVYGEHVANVLVGQCAYKAILKLYSRATADWACGLAGDFEHLEEAVSYTYGTSDSQTLSYHVQKREAVLATEFMTLAKSNRERFEGWFISPDKVQHRPVPHGCLLIDPDDDVPNFNRRPDPDYDLPPWTDDEARSFRTPAGPAVQGGEGKPPAPDDLWSIPRIRTEIRR